MNDALKTKWRPVFAWVFIGFFVALSITVLGMLWLKLATLDQAVGILITMVAAGGGVTGSYAVGRSWEKRHGMSETVPPLGYQEGY